MGTGSVLGNNQNSGQAGYGPSYGNTSINQPFQNGAATPQGTTPIMPTQPIPTNFGTGAQMQTYDGSGSVMQMYGGIPQRTTPAMPAPPPPRNFGTGVEMPTYDGTGSVMQSFGGMPSNNMPTRNVMPVGPTNFQNPTVSRPVLPLPRLPMTQPISQTAVSPAKQRAMARALRRR